MTILEYKNPVIAALFPVSWLSDHRNPVITALFPVDWKLSDNRNPVIAALFPVNWRLSDVTFGFCLISRQRKNVMCIVLLTVSVLLHLLG